MIHYFQLARRLGDIDLAIECLSGGHLWTDEAISPDAGISRPGPKHNRKGARIPTSPIAGVSIWNLGTCGSKAISNAIPQHAIWLILRSHYLAAANGSAGQDEMRCLMTNMLSFSESIKLTAGQAGNEDELDVE
jgi:hypothetical protein